MCRKSIFILTCLLLSLILCSCGKKHDPLVQKDGINEITIESSNIPLKSYKDKDDISTIIEYLNNAKWEKESTNDAPQEDNVGTITLKGKETQKIYFYQNKLESPYIGIYKQSKSIEDLLKSLN